MSAAAWIRGIHLGILIVLSAFFLLIGLAAASSAQWTLPSIDRAIAFLTTCPYRTATGQPCPLCGSVTAFIHLFRGDIHTAISANAFAAVLAPTLIVQFFYRFYRSLYPVFFWKQEIVLFTTGIVLGALIAAPIFFQP